MGLPNSCLEFAIIKLLSHSALKSHCLVTITLKERNNRFTLQEIITIKFKEA